MIDIETKEIISEELERVVSKFNEKFEHWQKITGCRANFGWEYGDKDLPKKLIIKDIDAMIYVKPEPEWVKIQDGLSSSTEKL